MNSFSYSSEGKIYSGFRVMRSGQLGASERSETINLSLSALCYSAHAVPQYSRVIERMVRICQFKLLERHPQEGRGGRNRDESLVVGSASRKVAIFVLVVQFMMF